MQQELLSIVVPVYNGEEYIGRCLDSLIHQTYKQIEIIVVNDGSTDATEKICTDYARNDNRVKLFNQENSGVAKTRKNGANAATGNYIAFVDADDYVDLDMYETLMPYTQDADLVTSGYHQGSADVYDVIPEGLYKNEEEREYLYGNMIHSFEKENRGLTPYIWNKIFMTDIANEVFAEINEGIFIGEDSEFVYRYALKSASCYVVHSCKYHYIVREGSAVNSVNRNYLKCVNDLYNSLEPVFSNSEYRDVLIPQLEWWISDFLSCAGKFLGFKNQANKIEYILPYMNMLDNKKVIIYGAGLIGQNYYYQCKKYQSMDIVAWVDKKWEVYQEKGYMVEPVSKINEIEYDYVLIAVKKKELFEEIKNELVADGVLEEKLLWKKPVSTIVFRDGE